MNVKRFIKRAGGSLCGSRLLAPLVCSRVRNSINVVYYHFVGEPAPHYDAFYSGCTLECFSKDLERLVRVFTFAPLAEVIASDGSARKPKIAVTFDDGFDLHQTGVMEVLARFGVPATTFVITSCVDNQALMWRHKLSAIRSLAPKATCIAEYNKLAVGKSLPPIQSTGQLMDAASRWEMTTKDSLAAELWENCSLQPLGEYLSAHKPYFSWDGLRRWLAAGHSVGFHTHSHPDCARLQAADLEGELIGPAMNLKNKLNLKELCLSYPFGSRLLRPLEDHIFSRNIFQAIFGIKGFRKKGVSNQRLERAGVEQDGVGWPVFAHSLLNGFARNRD
jgi:peptidoglycan/xylan/chitin deacetylase (PgdA/CDA1 family)